MRFAPSMTCYAALVAALAIARAATAAPTRFEFRCVGEATVTKPGIEPIRKTTHAGLAVDLTANRWCWRSGVGCFRAFPIVARHGSRLVLRDGRTAQGSSLVELDLATRRYVSDIHIALPEQPPIDSAETGRCTSAPLGLPV